MKPAVGPLYPCLSLEAVRGKAYESSRWTTLSKSKVKV